MVNIDMTGVVAHGSPRQESCLVVDSSLWCHSAVTLIAVEELYDGAAQQPLTTENLLH